MKRELTFDLIMQYHQKNLSEQEHQRIKVVIENNLHYQRILTGIQQMEQQDKENPRQIVNAAKQRFFDKFFCICLLIFCLCFLSASREQVINLASDYEVSNYSIVSIKV